MTLSGQLIAALAQGARRLLVGLLLLVPSVDIAFAENLQLFPTELKARQHCDSSDIVVWLNTATGIYHLKGMRWYGNTTSEPPVPGHPRWARSVRRHDSSHQA
jgi:hypothetical protein